MGKDFINTGGFDSLISGSDKKQAPTKLGRPVTVTKEINKTSEIGTREDETRATFIVNIANLEKIKDIAYWEREEIKVIAGAALSEYINNYEAKKGPVKPRTKK